ncbi:hypothetical protein ACFP51_07725 [Streptomyces pratens]|uniref:hypothetical protein n=1 Tax=Streptomyces pratens TaxID=887456 RepID=UPI00362415F3
MILVSVNALVLWLIVRLTGLLHVDGFWPLVGTVALMWAAEWPSRLAKAVAEARANPPQPPHDPFWPEHHMPQTPLFGLPDHPAEAAWRPGQEAGPAIRMACSDSRMLGLACQAPAPAIHLHETR